MDTTREISDDELIGHLVSALLSLRALATDDTQKAIANNALYFYKQATCREL